MYCPKCAVELQEGSRVCPNCNYRSPMPKGRMLMIIVITVIITALASIGIFLLVTMEKPDYYNDVQALYDSVTRFDSEVSALAALTNNTEISKDEYMKQTDKVLENLENLKNDIDTRVVRIEEFLKSDFGATDCMTAVDNCEMCIYYLTELRDYCIPKEVSEDTAAEKIDDGIYDFDTWKDGMSTLQEDYDNTMKSMKSGPAFSNLSSLKSNICYYDLKDYLNKKEG